MNDNNHKPPVAELRPYRSLRQMLEDLSMNEFFIVFSIFTLALNIWQYVYRGDQPAFNIVFGIFWLILLIVHIARAVKTKREILREFTPYDAMRQRAYDELSSKVEWWQQPPEPKEFSQELTLTGKRLCDDPARIRRYVVTRPNTDGS